MDQQQEDKVTLDLINEACSLLEIDEVGLNKHARKVLIYFLSHNNQPCGLISLASACNISRETVEHEIYPVLNNLGFLEGKGTRGKCLTSKGLNHATKITSST